jgi:hypothetical protein
MTFCFFMKFSKQTVLIAVKFAQGKTLFQIVLLP